MKLEDIVKTLEGGIRVYKELANDNGMCGDHQYYDIMVGEIEEVEKVVEYIKEYYYLDQEMYSIHFKELKDSLENNFGNEIFENIKILMKVYLTRKIKEKIQLEEKIEMIGIIKRLGEDYTEY